MKINAIKGNILPILTSCAAATDRRSTMVVLGNLLLEAKEPQSLLVIGTDLYTTIGGAAIVDVVEPGAITLPAKEFIDRIKKMPDGPMVIEVKDDTAVIRATGARRYQLRGIEASAFPHVPGPPRKASTLRMPSRKLCSMIKRTEQSVSGDTSRPNLNGFSIRSRGSHVVFATSDGHRMCEVWWDSVDQVLPEPIVVPAKPMLELERLLSGLDTEVALQVAQGLLHVEAGRVRVSIKLIDSPFPSYDQFMEQLARTTSVRVASAPLLDAIQAVGLNTTKDKVGISLAIEDAKVRLQADMNQVGSAEDEVPCMTHDGPAATFSASWVYLVDAVSSVDAQEVSISFGSAMEPVLFEGHDGRCVVMTMHL